MPENAPTTPTAPTLNEQEKKSDRIYRFIISALCFAMCTVQIVNVIYPFFISSEFFVIHFMFGMLMCYLVYDYKGKKRYFYSPAKIFDIILALGVAAVAIYILRDIDAFLLRMDLVASPTDIVMGAICTVIVLEGCRRLTGPSLPAIALITILYALFGKYLPGLIGHKGYSFTRVIKTIFSQQGIFGMPIGVSANTVFLFLLFGAFLNVCGADLIFRDLSTALAGRKRGGPAKIAIIASAIFGTISGSSVANVVSTGTFTIPMMKRCGYRPVFAGAVEAVASTGGQIMPPIMGAAAFILAEMTGIGYGTVCVAAAIPAFLYYISVFIMVDVEALKNDLLGMDEKDIPLLIPVLKRSAKLIIPVVVLIVTLVVFNITPMRCALYAMAAVVLCALFDKNDRFSFKHLKNAFCQAAIGSAQIVAACAASGIVIAMLSLTGLGLKFSNFILTLGGSNLVLCLVFSMLVSIILGMGLPTTAAYIITATTIAPSLLKLGLPPLCAHLFLFYFASLSCITPPVAIASYAGAAVADANPSKVGWEAVRIPSALPPALSCWISPALPLALPVFSPRCLLCWRRCPLRGSCRATPTAGSASCGGCCSRSVRSCSSSRISSSRSPRPSSCWVSTTCTSVTMSKAAPSPLNFSLNFHKCPRRPALHPGESGGCLLLRFSAFPAHRPQAKPPAGRPGVAGAACGLPAPHSPKSQQRTGSRRRCARRPFGLFTPPAALRPFSLSAAGQGRGKKKGPTGACTNK